MALKTGKLSPFMFFRYKLSMEIDIEPFAGKRPPQAQSWQTYAPPKSGGLDDLIRRPYMIGVLESSCVSRIPAFS